jgi:hypothetical protein
MKQLNIFFDRVKDLSFWNRLFKWSSVQRLSYEAIEGLTLLNSSYNELLFRINESEGNIKSFEQDLAITKASETSFQTQLAAKTQELSNSKEREAESNEKLAASIKTVTELQGERQQEFANYEKGVTKLNNAQDSLDQEKQRVNDARVEEKALELEKMKTTWQEHEQRVEQELRRLCMKHTVAYLESVPFRGKPDNPIEICEEIVIFDAKSPSNNDLSNFPKYIKAQTDSASKYAKQSGVKKDIYLVIPSNTVDAISKFHYDMVDYDVYIITFDALEPILLSLKKVEEYEFADKLSPEDRSSITRILGKYAHATKRRIQIDQFMNGHMLGLLKDAETNLPEDFQDAVSKIEKAEKLNPSTERRTKEINTEKLSDSYQKINQEAIIHELEMPDKLEELQ